MKITKKLYVHWRANQHSDNGGHYTVWDMNMCSMEEYGKPLAVQDVTFEVPEINGRERLIDQLKREKADIISEATRKAGQLEEKIQQLLALPSAEVA
jgi:hypothetical protein